MDLPVLFHVNTQHLEVDKMSKTNAIQIAYLSLGSNIDDRLGYLTKATKLLNEHINIHVKKISSVYETTAWGLENQNDFYNIVLEIKTNLSPKDLLSVCQKIEDELGRTREIHWGPRTLDIDILLYENIKLKEENLTIPHQYILERPFVTTPLAEIAPNKWVNGIKISTVAKQHSKIENKCFKTMYKIEIG